ncbi:hypothetical protein DFH09DRAFT_1316511 [Mycena vulgaris]|nr:hypothetical protein DFH09DRAFT_1316511 [Mycena vulgaris]
MPPRHRDPETDIPIDPVHLAESATAIQAAPGPPPKSKASSWPLQDEKALLAFLLERVAEAGDGCNFTKVTWTAAAVVLNQQITKGGPKTGDSCKSKYQKLKALFLLVRDIINNSGWAWDDTRGACIGPANEGTWEAWVVKNPKAEPFRNAGWCHLDAFRTLMPEAAPRGTHVFRAQVTPPQRLFPRSQLDQDDDPYEWGNSDDENEGLKEKNSDSSDEDTDKENELPANTPKMPATSRKRTAATPASATGTAKKARVSGAAALQDIAGQALDFNAILRDAFGPTAPAGTTNVPPTPVRLQKAIKRAQKLETWMEKEQLVSLLEVLEEKRGAINVYDSLDDEELRIRWVKRKVGITT